MHARVKQRVVAINVRIYSERVRDRGDSRNVAVVNACKFLKGVRERGDNRIVAGVISYFYLFWYTSV